MDSTVSLSMVKIWLRMWFKSVLGEVRWHEVGWEEVRTGVNLLVNLVYIPD